MLFSFCLSRGGLPSRCSFITTSSILYRGRVSPEPLKNPPKESLFPFRGAGGAATAMDVAVRLRHEFGRKLVLISLSFTAASIRGQKTAHAAQNGLGH